MTCMVVLDNTVLSNFASINHAEIVLNLWRELACTTPGVLEEHQAAIQNRGYPRDCWTALSVLELTRAESLFASQLPPRLGPGERECLAIAVHRNTVFASDDRDARALARTKGIALSGTLGILLANVQLGLLTSQQANSFLQQMIAAGYRAPIDNLGAL